ncbi:MAG: permease-like cell division protein FtsX [Gammaproteobacteria bacterium]|nr:permease-like cell division protein FtsX [Gammaproteobacteria bacterium]MDH5628721.1 permease-like cell division protein FtsX [Gammaproteobacteria bacterium]
MSQDTLTGARFSQGATFSAKLSMWFRLHRIESKRGIKDIFSNPVSNFMTVLVIAIALALPTGLHIFLQNGQTLFQNWDGVSRISLFLKSEVSDNRLQQLAKEIEVRKDVAKVTVISKTQALEDFKQTSGFSEAIDQLDINPLPAVIEIQPAGNVISPEASDAMLQSLKALPEVEIAKLDLEWVRRLHAILQFAEKIAAALSLALAASVLLIVGNTIRLSVQNRREEIEIVKLVGATDAFIRRPFLYTGFWYGLLAGVCCWVLISGSLYWLDDSIRLLASEYKSQFQLQGLNLVQNLQLIGVACFLGLLGSWLSVGRHIRQIEPR